MKLIYAPSFREQMDLLHANCLVSFDIQTLETLLAKNNRGGGHNVLYLPHKNTPKDYSKVILDALKPYKQNLKTIHSPKSAKDCDAIITDTSNLALEFIFHYKKPCIFLLSDFANGIDFNENALLCKILETLSYRANSLQALENIINTLPNTLQSKKDAYLEFLNGDLL